jgi:hypothetical protein
MHKYSLLDGAALPVGFDQLEVFAVLPALDGSYVDAASFGLWVLKLSAHTIASFTAACKSVAARSESASLV